MKELTSRKTWWILLPKKIKQDKLLSAAINDKIHKIKLSVQNAEKLSVYADASFDRYISSLCLMLTGNAENMLRESYRVLKPQGIAAFSVWGYREKSLYFESFSKTSIFEKIHSEMGWVDENKT